ncbi:MAG TPA: peptidyl-prolyl cis-trans isomerase [Thermoanaerobaculia bacterium]|nr:peptidyl-prolyl cis-trans isomerase [Thermoanaerobaculia bacterium]
MRKLRTLPLPLLLLVPALFPAPAILRADVVNRIVLRVNDQIATLRDYEQRRQDLTRDVSRRPNMDPEERSRMLEQVPQLVFRDLYQELLLESRAQQLAIEVSHAQIDAAVENMKQNFGIKTDEDFRQALAQSGMTEDQLRASMEKQLRIRDLMDREVRSKIKLEEEDLRRYYRKNIEQFRQPEQVHLREVVVLEQGGLPTADERSRTAAEIRQAVTGGKSLADAIADLQPKGITSNVIDLGWVGHGDLDATLEAAAWKLAPGAITEPVAGRGGLHLLQVAERHESRIPAFSEVSQQIQEQEQERVYSEEFNKYMAELEKKSLIVASPPQEAEGFRSLLTRPVADRLELQPAQVQSQPRIGTEGRTPPADSVQGAPGALPQPKPVDTTPPPVAPPPAH